MQIIAVANQKGGVGKTTTSTVLASGLYSKWHRVLLCDLDPQTNASFMTGVDVLSVANLYDVFKGVSICSKRLWIQSKSSMIIL